MFWNISIPVLWKDQYDREGWSQEDSKVIELWDKETTKVNGHYMVPIPLKHPDERIPNNVNVARSMVSSLAKRLMKEGKYDHYDNEITELLNHGYAEVIPENEILSNLANINGLQEQTDCLKSRSRSRYGRKHLT